jgi:hypothetical protein
MAKKVSSPVGDPQKRVRSETEPKFPYTTKPSSLRRLLQEIPKKPRPPKFDMKLLKAWGFSDANDHSMLRVLKAVGLLNDKNEPTELYSHYMHLEGGAAALAAPMRKLYEPLFNVSHTPYTESNEKLQNLFNIHSGGSDRALEQQIQTFKALAENTKFDGAILLSPSPPPGGLPPGIPPAGSALGTTAININLHIHLPENKTQREYQGMIEDIGRYIFGRPSSNE